MERRRRLPPCTGLAFLALVACDPGPEMLSVTGDLRAPPPRAPRTPAGSRPYLPPIRPSGPSEPSTHLDAGLPARGDWRDRYDAAFVDDATILGTADAGILSECEDAGAGDLWRACACPGDSALELEVGRHCIAYPRPEAECSQFFVREIGHEDCIMNLVGEEVSTWRWTQPPPSSEYYGADFGVSLMGSPLTPDGHLAIAGAPGGEIDDWSLLLEWPSQGRSEIYLMQHVWRHEALRRLAVIIYERR